jgi:hypothetical protein
MRKNMGVPPSGSRHSPSGLSRDASQAQPSVPNATELWPLVAEIGDWVFERREITDWFVNPQGARTSKGFTVRRLDEQSERTGG